MNNTNESGLNLSFRLYLSSYCPFSGMRLLFAKIFEAVRTILLCSAKTLIPDGQGHGLSDVRSSVSTAARICYTLHVGGVLSYAAPFCLHFALAAVILVGVCAWVLTALCGSCVLIMPFKRPVCEPFVKCFKNCGARPFPIASRAPAVHDREHHRW